MNPVNTSVSLYIIIQRTRYNINTVTKAKPLGKIISKHSLPSTVQHHLKSPLELSHTYDETLFQRHKINSVFKWGWEWERGVIMLKKGWFGESLLDKCASEKKKKSLLGLMSSQIYRWSKTPMLTLNRNFCYKTNKRSSTNTTFSLKTMKIQYRPRPVLSRKAQMTANSNKQQRTTTVADTDSNTRQNPGNVFSLAMNLVPFL